MAQADGPGLWRGLGVGPGELRLDALLQCGQSFTWVATAQHQWTNVLAGRAVTLRQTEDEVLFRLWGEAGAEECEGYVEVLRAYFQLHVQLKDLVGQWALKDSTIQALVVRLPGLRILCQDPSETLVGFICSSNNNIARITAMVGALKQRFGRQVAGPEGHAMYCFPDWEAMAGPGTEEVLRGLGFGYRAKYVAGTARQLLAAHGSGQAVAQWLAGLRNVDYDTARTELMALPGVGPKVADCVCLMALGQHGAVPVDVHMWRLAQAHMPCLRTRTLTPALHAEVAAFYRSRYGPYAGWAQTVLFTGDLKRFEHRLAAAPGPDPNSNPQQQQTEKRKATAWEEQPPTTPRRKTRG